MIEHPPNPYGSCFDATAFNLLANLDTPGITVCHGIGIASRPGQEGMKIAHAWLEADHRTAGRLALDCVWLQFSPADTYRKNLKTSHVVEYTPKEVMDLWALHDNPGPWDPEILQFTSEAIALKMDNAYRVTVL